MKNRLDNLLDKFFNELCNEIYLIIFTFIHELKHAFDENILLEVLRDKKISIEDFLKLDLVKEKSANNMYKSIQESKQRPLTRFLTALSIRMSGRQQAYADRGVETENQFAESLAEISTIEKPAKVEGRHIIMILAPKVAKK